MVCSIVLAVFRPVNATFALSRTSIGDCSSCNPGICDTIKSMKVWDKNS